MTFEQIERLKEIRQTIADEIRAMADTPRIARAVMQSREGKGRGRHLQAAQGSIRTVEEVDKMLYAVAGIKKLPKPKYPGGERV
jgi:hypothetical protein